jgi:hypothetical protein
MTRSIRLTKPSHTTLALIALGAMALTACDSKKAATDSATAAAPPAAATPGAAPATAPAGAVPTAAVMIVSPKEGDSTGADVTVVLSKQGVDIQKANGARAEGVGHYHLFIDTTSTADGQVIPPTDKHIVHIGTGDSTFTLKGLTPGPHEIVAVIGYGDHSTMAAKRDSVHFVVKH